MREMQRNVEKYREICKLNASFNCLNNNKSGLPLALCIMQNHYISTYFDNILDIIKYYNYIIDYIHINYKIVINDLIIDPDIL